MRDTYRIALVFDPTFGRKMFTLADMMYIWILGSKDNYEIAKQYWKIYPCESVIDPLTGCIGIKENWEHGVTVMEDTTTQFDNELLDDIWDHHGIYAHDPPLSEILVIGLSLTADVLGVIDDYGLTIICQEDNWFLLRDNEYSHNDLPDQTENNDEICEEISVLFKTISQRERNQIKSKIP